MAAMDCAIDVERILENFQISGKAERLKDAPS
jgi:hypothetical protein